MLEQGLTFYIIIFVILVTVFVASFLIPLFGFMSRWWKGLALGCLLQPFVCVTACLLMVAGVVSYQQMALRRHRQSAMVSVQKTEMVDSTEHKYIWHLKADNECLYEHRSSLSLSIHEQGKNIHLYDVVPVGPTSVSVDDHIVVVFDLDHHSVTATDYGEPIEVASVDWDRVKKYFSQQKAAL